MLNPGDVILTRMQFADTFDIKIRPAVVLFEEFDNIVVAGITSNTKMAGIPLTKKEGAYKESIIKLNYIFTISRAMIQKHLFTLSNDKKKRLYQEFKNKLEPLIQ